MRCSAGDSEKHTHPLSAGAAVPFAVSYTAKFSAAWWPLPSRGRRPPPWSTPAALRRGGHPVVSHPR
eukprot:5152083-Prymnesium_polylepis.1